MEKIYLNRTQQQTTPTNNTKNNDFLESGLAFSSQGNKLYC